MVLQLVKRYEEADIREGQLDLSGFSSKVAKFGKIIDEDVVGQADAKITLLNILEEIISGININTEGYQKPIASLFFAGPSGVGKTLLGRVMQRILNQVFGNSVEMIKINCADFSSEQGFTLSQLIGASAGYFDSNKKPRLHPDNVKGKGRVILFDEIEKGGRPFWNILLAILDDGTLDINYSPGKKGQGNDTKDDAGQTMSLFGSLLDKISQEEVAYLRAYFKDTIVIMTSNVGNERIETEVKPGMGFNNRATPVDLLNLEEIILEEFSKSFRLELQGRFNYIVPFKHLTKEDVTQIVNILIQRISNQFINLDGGGIILFDDKVKAYIIDEIFKNPGLRKYGGRYIENYFKKYLVPNIAKIINSGQLQKSEKMIVVSTIEDKIVFSAQEMVNTVVNLVNARTGEVLRS